MQAYIYPLMEEKYQAVAAALNGEFNFTKQKITMADGLKDFQFIFNIKVPYKNEHILVRHHEGVLTMGDVFVEFKSNITEADFSIKTFSLIERLFRKRNSSFKIRAKTTKPFLVKNEALKEVLNLCKNTSFEPTINGIEGQTHFSILSEYNLLDEDKTHMIVPLVNFYKSFMDEYAR